MVGVIALASCSAPVIAFSRPAPLRGDRHAGADARRPRGPGLRRLRQHLRAARHLRRDGQGRGQHPPRRAADRQAAAGRGRHLDRARHGHPAHLGQGESPEDAAVTARTAAQAFANSISDNQLVMASLVDPAEPPDAPIQPRPPLIIATAALLGRWRPSCSRSRSSGCAAASRRRRTWPSSPTRRCSAASPAIAACSAARRG